MPLRQARTQLPRRRPPRCCRHLAQLRTGPSVLNQKFVSLLGGLRLQRAEAEAFDAGQDVGRGLGPAERLWGGVVLVDEAGDGGLEPCHALVNTAPDLLFGDEGEESLDLVEPRRAGGREVDVPARALDQPVADQLRLVSGVVVHHHMHV